MEIGYVRVSSTDQNPVRQLDGVMLEKVFEDRVSGATKDRPQLSACLDFCREGDTLHIHSIDRLARNLADLLTLIKRLTGKGVRIKFHKENMVFDQSQSPIQNLHLQILGAVAEFERELIRERQAEGIAQAKKRGVYARRKRKLSPEQMEDIRRRANEEHEHKTALAREYHVSVMTIYRVLNK